MPRKPHPNPYQPPLFDPSEAAEPKRIAEPAITGEAFLAGSLRDSPSALGATEILSELLGISTEEVTEMLREGGGFPEVIRLADYARLMLPHMTERRSRLIGLMNRWSQLLHLSTLDERPQICIPADAANLLMPYMHMLEQEELWVVALDTKHRVKQMVTVYKGSLNAASVRVGEVFRMPISKIAAEIIIAHNHPSGDPTPSPDDVRLTEVIVKAGSLLDIEVMDHLVIGRNQFVSLKERGLGGFR